MQIIPASGGGGSWGSITGTLSSQSDLQTALNAKQPLDSLLTAIAASTDPTANGVYGLASSPAGALSWNTSPNFKGPTPFVNALAPQFFVSNSTATTTGTISSGTASLVVASASDFVIGQGIYIKGAGTAGGVLETTITNISGTTFTLAANASTTATTQEVGHSDTAGIQAALDFAVSANVGSAGQVFLPPGIYNVSSLNIPHECWLVGSGQRNTELQSIPGATALGVVIMDGTNKGCGLFNLVIDGQKGASPAPTGSGIYITSSQTGGLRDHRIENVTVIDCTGDGVLMTTTGGNYVIATYFRNVYVSSVNGHGFHLATSNVTDHIFVSCFAGLCGLNGWHILGTTTQYVGCGADDSGQVDATTYGDGWCFSGSGAVGHMVWGGRSANNLRHSLYLTGSNKTNTIYMSSYDPRGDHVNIAGGTDNDIHCTAAAPFSAANSDSMLNASGGSGNVLHLTWASTAITATALTGAALASQTIHQNGAYYGAADQTLLDGSDLVLGTTTGTKIGTATSQKLGFFNATPIVQNTSTTDLRTGLINLGFFATGGASPLNLNGGAFIAGTATVGASTSRDTFHVLSTSGGSLMERISADSTAYQNISLKARGTPGSEAAINAGDVLMNFVARGWDGTGSYSSYVQNHAVIRVMATGTPSGSDHGAKWEIRNCAAGSTTVTTRLTIDENGLTLADAHNLVTGTTTGMKIGTSTTQKLGFWNATPVVRGSAWTLTNVTTDRSYDANATTLDEVADALGTLVAELQTMGLLG